MKSFKRPSLTIWGFGALVFSLVLVVDALIELISAGLDEVPTTLGLLLLGTAAGWIWTLGIFFVAQRPGFGRPLGFLMCVAYVPILLWTPTDILASGFLTGMLVA
jgi:hypothetical protein